MKILLKNCCIINPFGEREFIADGCIGIQDDTIEAVETSLNDETGYDQVIDLNGKTVIPGMINAHAHLYSALAMGMPFPSGNPKNFTEILKQVWWILDRALDEDSTHASFEAGLLEHLRHGVTTVIDHHSSQSFIRGSLQLLANTAENFGVNISSAFEITDRNGKEAFENGLDENIRFHRAFMDHKNVRPLIGLHASFTLSDVSLKQIADALSHERGWGIHVHTAEDKADQEDAKKRGYHSVLTRLDKFGLLNENSLIIHGVYCQPGDDEIIKRTGAMLVHNPSSNANNRVGITPMEFINSVKAGLGTDGMQGNMLAEAKEGTLIRSSHLSGEEASVNYLELLFGNNPVIATRLFGRKIGRLKPGYRADLAIYDYEPRTKIHAENWIGHVLFGMSRPADVMTGGEFKIRDYKFTDINEDAIFRNSRIQSERLWNRMKTI